MVIAAVDSRYRVLNAFAGPGGWDVGAQIIGLHEQILGADIDEAACTAAISAGFDRQVGDVCELNPADFPHVKGFIASTPCPTFSTAGRRSGLGDDYQRVLDVITHVGSSDCDCPWEEIITELDDIADPRTALAAQTIRFAMALPNVEWLAFEQVLAAEYMFDDLAAELYYWGWESVDVFTVDAADLGLPLRRKRVFLTASQYTPHGCADSHPMVVRMAERSPAQVLGWPAGEMIRTRGNRRNTGGNLFSADRTGWCATEKMRSWCRDSDGLRFEPSESGLLQGFRADYPWTGSRTRQFRQLADVVCPPVAAAVLGHVTNRPWKQPVHDYLSNLYRTPHSVDDYDQMEAG